MVTVFFVVILKIWHFFTLKRMIQSSVHFVSYSRSFWRVVKSLSLIISPDTRQASAKSSISDSMLWVMSLIYRRNRSEPNTVRCSTPDSLFAGSDFSASSITGWSLLGNQYLIHQMQSGSMRQLSSLTINQECRTVSNALAKSKYYNVCLLLFILIVYVNGLY